MKYTPIILRGHSVEVPAKANCKLCSHESVSFASGKHSCVVLQEIIFTHGNPSYIRPHRACMEARKMVKIATKTVTDAKSYKVLDDMPCQCAAGPWRPIKELRVKHGTVLLRRKVGAGSVFTIGSFLSRNFIETEMEDEAISNFESFAEIRRPK